MVVTGLLVLVLPFSLGTAPAWAGKGPTAVAPAETTIPVHVVAAVPGSASAQAT
jgi:hypothetical protein